jgi:hypothetical protein
MASLDSPVNSTNTARRIEFSSNGTSTVESALISCTALGTVKPAITGYAVSWVPTTTQQARTITNVKMWLSTGIYASNTAIPYRVTVEAVLYVAGVAQAPITSSISTAVLLGTSAENQQVNFNVPNGISLSRVTRVVFRVKDVGLGTGTPVKFNAGGGKSCGATTTVNSSTLASYRTGSAVQIISRATQ